jgi:hypothetical protein
MFCQHIFENRIAMFSLELIDCSEQISFGESVSRLVNTSTTCYRTRMFISVFSSWTKYRKYGHQESMSVTRYIPLYYEVLPNCMEY